MSNSRLDADTPFDLAAVNRMDRQALGCLHDWLYPQVERYLRYQLQDEQLVEDLAADVFLRMIDTLKRGTKLQDPRAWALGTASHLVQDHLRRKYSRKTEPLDAFDDLFLDDSPEQAAEDAQRKRQVQEAVGRLTEDQRHILALRFSQGFSLEETAASAGKTIEAVKVLQFRALASLRRLLDVRKDDD